MPTKLRLKLSTLRTIILVIAFSLLFGSIGYTIGKKDTAIEWNGKNASVSIINNMPPQDKNIDFGLFWEVWDRLETDYIDKSKLDYQKMVWGAISGMTASLEDPYTVFLPPEQNKEAKDGLNGTFEGIGAQLGSKEGKIVVVAPLKGMPAEVAGIRAGDWILKVNDEETGGWTVPQTVDKIRGPKGEKVRLTVLHEGEDKPSEIEVKRDTIQVPSVETEFRDTVAILKLYQFGDNTNTEWEKAVKTIQTECFTGTKKCKGIVFDVRNNPGGYLQGSVFVASEFLKDGTVVVQEHASGRREVYEVNRKGSFTTIPLVVLINKGSASASEIVAGALKVRGRAKLVGEQSFGKGSVQEAQDLSGGAGLHITTAKWLLPDDSWISGTGVSPDVVVVDDPETKEVDEQLEKAIETLIP